MNIERMEKLADYLETVPTHRFDMTNWHSTAAWASEIPTEWECDTCGCVAGHTVYLFKDEVNVDTLYIPVAAQQILDLNSDQQYRLFMAGSIRGPRPLMKISKEEMVAEIRLMIKEERETA